MFSEGSSSGISISAMGVIPVSLKTLIERNYQVAEKKEDDLHEQEEEILMIMRTIWLPFRIETVENSLLWSVEYC